ncbi:MucBP domain-containing protein [Enterococcus hirae]
MKSIRLLGATLLASTTLLGAGQAFAASEPSTPDPANAQTPVNTALTINDTPTAPEPPQNPDGGTDEGTGITGLFGIAYAPKALSGTTQLQEQGETEVSLSNNSATNDQNKYNVGVQDKTRAKDRDWSLTAQLEWTGDTQNYLAGSTITATGGNVKLNDGQGNLSEVADSEVTIGDMATDVTISQDAPVEIMKANAGKTVNGVYNYQFQNPKLVVQNSENVAAGTYSGNIVWNLGLVPDNDQRTVTVKYVSNATGKEIHPAKTVTNNVGDHYDVSTNEYKLDLTDQGYQLDTSKLPTNATGTLTENQVVTYYYNAPAPVSLVNGSFETPVVTSSNQWQFFTSVPGWRTTNGRSYIELQNMNPFVGNQRASLRSDDEDALYQFVDTTPGDTLYWEFSHKGDNGADIAALEIYAANGSIVEQGRFTTGNTEWKTYSGFYKVPAGQTKTVFRLRAVSRGNGNNVDNVVFTNKQSTVTIHYVNEQGQKLKNSETIDGYEDQSYNYTEKVTNANIPGYQLDSNKLPSNIKGTFTSSNQDITVIYK